MLFGQRGILYPHRARGDKVNPGGSTRAFCRGAPRSILASVLLSQRHLLAARDMATARDCGRLAARFFDPLSGRARPRSFVEGTQPAMRVGGLRELVGSRSEERGRDGAAMKMGAQLISIGELSVGVWLHAESDPPADEWSASCRSVAEFAGAGVDLEHFRALIVTDGGTPDARQRKELFQDALRGYPAKISVITEAVANSPLKRGIATALTWMNPNFRVFEPGELMLALEHIGLDRTQFEAIWGCLAFIQRGLEPNATLRRIGARNRMPPSVPVPRGMSERPRSSGVLRAARAEKPSESGEREKESASRQTVADVAGRPTVAEVNQTGRIRKA
jgi:hypothetical protein